MFDDCDTVLFDEVRPNMLKAVLDRKSEQLVGTSPSTET